MITTLWTKFALVKVYDLYDNMIFKKLYLFWILVEQTWYCQSTQKEVLSDINTVLMYEIMIYIKEA